jgi:hypothetical protein
MLKLKKSLRSTRRDLHHLLDYDGREAAMDWWTAAEDAMLTGNISGPASFLAMTMAFALALEDDARTAAGFNVVIRGGYALRTVLSTATSHIASLDVSLLDREPIADLATRPVDSETGVLAADDAVTAGNVLGPSAELVAEYADQKFDQVASVDVAFWQGTVALATYQLHKNVGRLDEGLVEMLLRYGFVLRAWEESLGITSDGHVGAQADGVPLPDPFDLQPDGGELDPEAWVNDAAVVCTNTHEQFAEVVLERSTIELLGVQRIVDGIIGEFWQGYDPAVEAGVSHVRFGYALRNRETQLIACYAEVRDGDPLASLAAERAENSGVKIAVVHRIVRDVLDYGGYGGRDLLYQRTTGTSPVARRVAIEYWASTFGERDPRLDGPTITRLIEHGYFLHRLFEIQPFYRDQ